MRVKVSACVFMCWPERVGSTTVCVGRASQKQHRVCVAVFEGLGAGGSVVWVCWLDVWHTHAPRSVFGWARLLQGRLQMPQHNTCTA